MSEITAEGLRASQIKNSKIPYNTMKRQQIIGIQQILFKTFFNWPAALLPA
ncbi:Uncharacterized protein dnm_071680 [Desulfonema magnum]|uniref:Uncharacterized protein n=1 Tax=Desulfonema magnum TaxID=45655 RepID=A0A975BT37_9BACT|nr:Uncharacterized protein dnm_071680 [Desulfonema magnum]